MRTHILFLIAIFLLSFSTYAYIKSQSNVAIIYIHKERGPLFVRDRSVIKRSISYEFKKIDAKNYLLAYSGIRPKVLYLNESPIYITPGDSLRLDIVRTLEFGRERDTITALGKRAENYTYAPIMLLDSRERRTFIGINYPNYQDPKYSKTGLSLYNDLKKYNSLAWRYVDSILSIRNYNRNIIRQMELDLFTWNMFTNVGYEDKLLLNNKNQLRDFADNLEKDFEAQNICPADTVYSPNIEGAISLFFGHLEQIKFADIRIDEQFFKLCSYIEKYPNQFVKGYLIYFLIQKHKTRLTGDRLKRLHLILEQLSSTFIINSLKSNTKNENSPLDILDIQKF